MCLWKCVVSLRRLQFYILFNTRLVGSLFNPNETYLYVCALFNGCAKPKAKVWRLFHPLYDTPLSILLGFRPLPLWLKNNLKYSTIAHWNSYYLVRQGLACPAEMGSTSRAPIVSYVLFVTDIDHSNNNYDSSVRSTTSTGSSTKGCVFTGTRSKRKRK